MSDPKQDKKAWAQVASNLARQFVGGQNLYRIDGIEYAWPEDDYGTPVGHGRCVLKKYIFPILRTTPKGQWISVYGLRKFVLSKARKRFAYPTQEEAIASFIARKNRQVTILTHNLEKAKMYLAMARKGEIQDA